MAPTSKERIYSVLFNRVIDGHYRGGTRLKEAELAAEFGVSRTPIREVLQLLAKDGMIEVLPNRGATVKPLTSDDIEEIYAIRKSLELLALEFAVANIQLDELARFKTRILRLSGDAEEAARLDAALHKYIVDCSRKERLIEMVEQLLRIMQRFRHIGFHISSVSQRVRDEHLELIERLMLRDLPGARRTLSEHLENSKNATLQFIFSKRVDSLVDAS